MTTREDNQMDKLDTGCKVAVIDGSGAFLIETGEHISGSAMTKRVWRIVDFVPMTEPRPMFGLKPYDNDCIIRSEDDVRQVVSIKSRFLRPLVNHCPTCRCDRVVH